MYAHLNALELAVYTGSGTSNQPTGLFASSINDVIYQCDGYDKHAGGTKTASFRASLAINSTDVALTCGFAPGTTGWFLGAPAGNTTDYIRVIAATAIVTSAPITAPVNGICVIDLDIQLNDIAYSCC